jgi:hypothetical protein
MKKLLLMLIIFLTPFARAMEKTELTSQLLALIDSPVCDLAEVQRLLDAGADPGLGFKNGWCYRKKPLISAAAQHGHEQVCKLLIGRGVAVNVWFEQVGCVMTSNTPLIDAANGGHEALCKMLIKAGSDVIFDRNYSHWSPQIQRLLCDRQEQLNNSLIATLICLRRLKQQDNQLGQLLYTHAGTLLRPYLASSYYPWLSEVKEMCETSECLAHEESWEDLKKVGVLSGALMVGIALEGLY